MLHHIYADGIEIMKGELNFSEAEKKFKYLGHITIRIY